MVCYFKTDDDGRFGIYKEEWLWTMASLSWCRSLFDRRNVRKSCIPRWSPKGDRIAFMSTAAGQWDIWMIEKEGTPVRLTKLEGNFLYPAWHPNGRRLFLLGI